MGNKGVHNGHAYVDLGLPSGTLWATKNINATNEKSFGNQFAWGDLECRSDNSSLFAYIRRDTETEMVLTKKWDVAHKNMGGGWHVPSEEQFQELIKNTKYRFFNDSVIFTSKINGNEIEFPYDTTNSIQYNGYWTSESKIAFVLDFKRYGGGFGFPYLTKNFHGYCIRGVVSKFELEKRT